MLRSKRASAGNDGLGRAESRPSRIGPISLGMKQMGARSAGNPHAACDVAGAGNAAWSRWCDTRRRKSEPTGNTNFDLNRRASPRPYLRERGGAIPPRHSPQHLCSQPARRRTGHGLCEPVLDQQAAAQGQRGEVKKTRKRHAVREMEVDPSKSLCRRRLQTAMSCFGQKPRWRDRKSASFLGSASRMTGARGASRQRLSTHSKGGSET